MVSEYCVCKWVSSNDELIHNATHNQCLETYIVPSQPAPPYLSRVAFRFYSDVFSSNPSDRLLRRNHGNDITSTSSRVVIEVGGHCCRLTRGDAASSSCTWVVSRPEHCFELTHWCHSAVSGCNSEESSVVIKCGWTMNEACISDALAGWCNMRGKFISWHCVSVWRLLYFAVEYRHTAAVTFNRPPTRTSFEWRPAV